MLAIATLMSISQLFATATDNNPGKDAKVIKRIPDCTLQITVDQEKDLLKVKLTGVANQLLNWYIFQPKEKASNHISTSSKIDEIKIESLKAGQYILMIKDEKGQALFRSFVKK